MDNNGGPAFPIPGAFASTGRRHGGVGRTGSRQGVSSMRQSNESESAFVKIILISLGIAVILLLLMWPVR